MSQIPVMSSSGATNEPECDCRPARVSYDSRGRADRDCPGLYRPHRQGPAGGRRHDAHPRYGPDAEPVRYPDPDVIVLDKRFAKIKIGNSPITRLHTGMLWAEGPAWNGVGKYLVMSDIPNDVQLRWLEDDGHVSVMRRPAGNSNGNTFDPEGRQISCEHGNRRVVRYEHDGKTTVLADRFGGKPLNAPNDPVVHPDGGIWFTDPGLWLTQRIRGQQGHARNQRGRVPDRPQNRPDSPRSPTTSSSPTASVSRPTTRRSTSPTPAPPITRRPRAISGLTTSSTASSSTRAASLCR